MLSPAADNASNRGRKLADFPLWFQSSPDCTNQVAVQRSRENGGERTPSGPFDVRGQSRGRASKGAVPREIRRDLGSGERSTG